MHWVFRTAVFAAVSVAFAACGSGIGAAPSLSPSSARADVAARPAGDESLPPNVVPACPAPADPSTARCLALIRTDSADKTRFAGYAPSDLQSAYSLPSATAGVGQTVAIVDAYDDPKAEKDLAKYRAFYGLPACGSQNSCFRKVNQKGGRKSYPVPSSAWAFEEALDVEVVSAVCPNCSIILIEANNPSPDNLGKAVDEAVKLGANVVSNSYSAYGLKGTRIAKYYDHPGTIVTGSAGDSGYGFAEPAGFATVVAVGGTKLVTGHNPRGWKETVWTRSGSGCDARLAKPAWQLDTGCTGRTMNDVAALADPARGVAVFDSYFEKGWTEGGGTSVGAPLIAAAYALAGNAASLNAAQSLYAPGASLWDVTEGSNGVCTRKYLCNARAGYDGPTGNGTPNGISAF